MDILIETFDPMYDITFIAFLREWLIPIAGTVAGAWMVMKLKKMDSHAQKRENTTKVTEFKIESIAHALSNAPTIGDHFKHEYEKKFNTLMKIDEYIHSNGKD